MSEEAAEDRRPGAAHDRPAETAQEPRRGELQDAAEDRRPAAAHDRRADEAQERFTDAARTEAGPATGDRPPLAAVLEALLLVVDEPTTTLALAAAAQAPVPDVEAELARLQAEYTAQGRGFELRSVAGGWRLYTRADCAPYVEAHLQEGQTARLTQAALETLAVIAYRQPVTRARVSAVRGVNVDGVVRTLLARGLVAEAGPDPDTAGMRYRTTPLLLEKLGLGSLEELPDLAPLLPGLDEMEDHQ